MNMGEIANLMIEGVLCCQCGQALYDDVIEQKLGYPIMCEECYNDLPEDARKHYIVETDLHNEQDSIRSKK